MKDPKLQKLYEHRFKAAKEYRKPFEEKWKVLTDMHHLKDDKHPNWDFVSFLKDYADSIGVRWDNGIFAGRQFFGLKGNPSQFDDNADNMAKTIQYQAEEENGLLVLLRNSLEPLSYLGNVILQAGWQGVAPAWSDIPLLDFWPQPKSSGIDKTMRWCIERKRYNIGKLRQLEEDGVLQDIDNIVNFVAPNKTGDTNKSGDDLALEARGVNLNTLDTADTSNKEDPDKEYVIFTMWEKNRSVSFEESSMEIISVPDMVEKPSGKLNTVLNAVGINKTMDGWTSNDYVNDKGEPYYPFVLLRPIPEKGVFYGRSPVEAHVVLQYEFNENRHQERATVDVIKKGIWLGRRGAGIDWSRLEKSAIVMGDSILPSDINRLDVGGSDLLSVFERTETGLIRMGDRAAGIWEPQRGGGEGNVTKTVGGLTLLIKEGNLKFARHINNIHTDGLKPLVMMCVWLNQQFLGDEEVEVRMAGTPIPISGEQRQGSFRYEMTSAPGLGQQGADQAMYGEMIQIYSTNPVLQPMVKFNELVKEHLKSSNLDPELVMWTQEEQDIIGENTMLKEQVMQLQSQIPQPVVGGGSAVATPPPAQPVKERVMI